MSQPSEQEPATGGPIRIAARVDKFKTLDEFVEGYSQYFFRGGILLPTRQPKDVGTLISLQIEIHDGVVALRADGTVEKIREDREGKPVGMVIRFKELQDDATKELIRRVLVAKRERQTGARAAVSTTKTDPNVPDARAEEQAGSTPSPERSAPGVPKQAPSPIHTLFGAPAVPQPDASLGAEDISAIADALDDSFDSIFGGSDAAPGPSLPSPDSSAISEIPTPARASADDLKRNLDDSPPPNSETLHGLRGFSETDATALRQTIADTLTPSDPDGDASSTEEPTLDLTRADDDVDQEVSPASESQPVGRINLQRVSKAELEAQRVSAEVSAAAADALLLSEDDDIPAAQTVDEPSESVRSLISSITSENQAIPDAETSSEALERLGIGLSATAPISSKDAADALDDILGDTAEPPEPISSMPIDAPIAPYEAPKKGLFARFFAWLGSLFGKKK